MLENNTNAPNFLLNNQRSFFLAGTLYDYKNKEIYKVVYLSRDSDPFNLTWVNHLKITYNTLKREVINKCFWKRGIGFGEICSNKYALEKKKIFKIWRIRIPDIYPGNTEGTRSPLF